MKLCKLLLRDLEEIPSRASSRLLRGYSRQTESYVSSLSNSADNSGRQDFEEPAYMGETDVGLLFKYKRPGSRAYSLPPRLGLLSMFH